MAQTSYTASDIDEMLRVYPGGSARTRLLILKSQFRHAVGLRQRIRY